MEADTKRRETVSSEGQKEGQSINLIRCGEFRHHQKTVFLELLIYFFLIQPSVDNKLLGVNQDTVLNPFNGDACLSKNKYHANPSPED